jgi:hypothetical protein
MIPKKDIYANRVLCLSWKSTSKANSRKLGYIFQKGIFLIGLSKSTKLLRTVRKNKKIKVKINGSEQDCRAKVIDDFTFTKAFLKKEMERLAGRKLSPHSRMLQKLDDIAARHVVVELKPAKT